MNSATRTAPRRTLLTAWCLLVAVSFVSRPLESVDLWWDLSRGREAARGVLRPCQNLLSLDHASEAAWLGGVPFFGIWSLGGIYALAAVPILLGLFLLWRVHASNANADRGATPLIVAPLLILAVRTGLEPTAWLWDLVGLSVTWAILRRGGGQRATLWRLGILFGLWANLGPRPLWGLMLVTLWPGLLAFRGRAVLVVMLAGLLTPRGPLTWIDSALLLAPSAFIPLAELTDARWRGFGLADWNLDSMAGALLWLVTAIAGWRATAGRASVSHVVMLAVPLATVLLARQNLAPAALWTALWWLIVRQEQQPVATVRRRWLRPAVMLVVTAVAIADAGGVLGHGSAGMGWGLSQSIDPRLFDIDELIPREAPVTAWCADARSAGVAAWASRKLKLVDHPLRALLGGRTHLHAELRRDLLSAHQSRYRRNDGAWGGWAHVLREWRAEILIVPAEDGDLHRSLIETPWKLIRLDSPTAPYASGEQPRFDRAVVDVMLQQGFVETGAWQPSLDAYDPRGWRVDVPALFGFPPNPAPAIRQSQFFRSIKLPMAALRSLLPMRAAEGSAAVREEFLQCQEQLALDEQIMTGHVSLLRRVALDVPGIPESHSSPWLRTTFGWGDQIDGSWRTCRDLYRDGRPQEAAQALTGEKTQMHYARGLLWLEAGDIDRARTSFERAAAASDESVRIAARYWLAQMSPAKEKSSAGTL